MSQLNPKLEPGDRIVLLHMDDPYSAVRMGTKGTVVKIVKVPFDMGYQYNVKWDDGSILDLLPEADSWVLSTDVKPKKNLTTEEQEFIDENHTFYSNMIPHFFEKYQGKKKIVNNAYTDLKESKKKSKKSLITKKKKQNQRDLLQHSPAFFVSFLKG